MTMPILSILANEADFLLVDKPPGLPCHRDGGEEGVLDVVRRQTGLPDLHLVHRLDQSTSGLLLLARGADAAAALGERFASHTMQKYYLAISDRIPKKKQGTVVGDMAASRNGSWKLLPTRNNPAVTQFFTAGTGEGGRLFLAKPLSGRTHQIRVALKSLGSPILGDSRYGGGAADRCYLHAYALAFELGGRSYSFRCPPSVGEYWQKPGIVTALNKFDVPWSLYWPRA